MYLSGYMKKVKVPPYSRGYLERRQVVLVDMPTNVIYWPTCGRNTMRLSLGCNLT